MEKVTGRSRSQRKRRRKQIREINCRIRRGALREKEKTII
jgi:hypothetical protein